MVRRPARGCARRLRGDGGYEAAFIGFLVARGVRIHRATPYLVKSYIRSLGLKAKTDRIDARALARFGDERGADLAPYRPPPESQRELAAVLTRREELVAGARPEGRASLNALCAWPRPIAPASPFTPTRHWPARSPPSLQR